LNCEGKIVVVVDSGASGVEVVIETALAKGVNKGVFIARLHPFEIQVMSNTLTLALEVTSGIYLGNSCSAVMRGLPLRRAFQEYPHRHIVVRAALWPPDST
jgi:hypothetical protein